MSDDLAEIRRAVTDIHTDLRLHDAKVDSNVARIADTQERVATAVERIGDATISIQALTEQMRVNGKSQPASSVPLDKRTVMLGLVVLLAASIAAGGGAELVTVLLSVLKK